VEQHDDLAVGLHNRIAQRVGGSELSVGRWKSEALGIVYEIVKFE
jgi:hypothetical protein